MKKNKYILLVLFSLLITPSKAVEYIQENYTHSLDGIRWVKIESHANIIIKTHDRNELLVQDFNGTFIVEKKPSKGDEDNSTLITLNRREKFPEMASDNTELGFFVSKEGDRLLVRNLRSLDGKIAVIYLPKTQKIHVEGMGSGHIKIVGMNEEIEVSNGDTGTIDIKDVTGPITANSTAGDISISFTKVNQNSPISISSAKGTIEIQLPAKTPANLDLNATLGKIATNFNINKLKKKSITGGQKIKTKINQGGVEIKVSSSIGNINLKKQ